MGSEGEWEWESYGVDETGDVGEDGEVSKVEGVGDG